MVTLSENVWNSLIISEGYRTTIYKDTRGIPTIGMGLALIKINSSKEYYIDFDLLTRLGMNTTTVTAALDQALGALNKVKNMENPFVVGMDLLNPAVRVEQEAKYGAVSQETFKNSFWPDVFQNYLSISKSKVGESIWNSLSINEQTALYSMVYNLPSLIGNGIKSALNLYVNGSNELSRYLGKLEVWNQILYKSNGGGSLGHQNRRCFEANEFIGASMTSLPGFGVGQEKPYSVIPVSTFDEANIAIAFMNLNKATMYNKLSSITNYGSDPYSYIQTNFSKAVEKIFGSRAYPEGFTLNKLFKEWNVLTDLSLQFDDDGRLNGEMKYETVAGTDKKDIIFLTATHDGATANGMNGDDVIYGAKDYTNIINAGQGSDTIYGGDKDDIVDGGMREDYGEDIVNHKDADQNIAYLYGGDDRYIGGLGDDTVYAGAGQDYVQPGLGVNYVDLGADNDQDVYVSLDAGLYFRDWVVNVGREDIIIIAGHFSSIKLINGEIIVDCLGEIRISGDVPSEVYDDDGNIYKLNAETGIYQRPSYDSLAPNATDLSDRLIGNAGANTIDGLKGNDYIVGGAGDDSLSGDEGNDTLYGGADNDELYGGIGVDYLYGGKGVDVLAGGDDDDYMYGEDGNDTLQDWDGDNLFEGGDGNDTLVGGYGNDKYYWNSGDDLDNLSEFGGHNVIYFGKSYSQAKFVIADNFGTGYMTANVKVYFDDAGEQGILFNNFAFGSTTDSNKLVFADGTAIMANVKDGWMFTANTTDQDLYGTVKNDIFYGSELNNSVVEKFHGGEGNDRFYGGGGVDEIYGGEGDDYIEGGAGNDILKGGYGNDIYKWNVGDGLDYLDESTGNSQYAYNKIVFGAGVGFDNLIFTSEYDSGLVPIHGIYVGNLNNGLRIYGQSAGYGTVIERLQFADGSVYKYRFGEYVLERNLVEGGLFNDTLTASGLDGVVRGFGGDDEIYATTGNHVIYGGQGNDVIHGGAGSNAYHYKRNDGLDLIYENGGQDKIVFGDGITYDNLSFERDGNDLKILVGEATVATRSMVASNAGVADGQGIVIVDFYATENAQIKKLEFADGTFYQWMNGAFAAEVPYADYNIVSGTDNDDIIEGTANDDVLFGREGNDSLFCNDGNNVAYGGDGNDRLFGGMNDDYLVGGKGDDYLSGNYGNDTYVWNIGDGWDTIQYDSYGTDKILFGEGIVAEDLSIVRDNNNLVITYDAQTRQGMVIQNFFANPAYKIETIEFADGSTLNLGTMSFPLNGGDHNIIFGSDITDYLTGMEISDVIMGGKGNDVIYGQGGNDHLLGGQGDDSLNGGVGHDQYTWNMGDGFDTIEDIAGTDFISFGEGVSYADLSFSKDGNDLKILVANEVTQGMKIVNFYGSDNNKIERLQFADGSVYIYENDRFVNINGEPEPDPYPEHNRVNGTGYNDYLYGTDGNDYLFGGQGNDVLNGLYGDDVYVWNIGDGFDTIDRDSYGADRILFGQGISEDDLTMSRDNNNLVILVNNNSNEGVQINGFFANPYYKVEFIEFANGLTVDLANMNFPLNGGDHNIIYGTENADYFTGMAVKDVIYGNGGNDVIYAQAGDDVLEGGLGNDTLDGGAGNDTFVWKMNDGFDSISDYAGTDKISFGEGVSFADLSFMRDGNDLKIVVGDDATQGMKIGNFYGGEAYQIENLEFADGSSYQYNGQNFAANQLIQAMAAFGAAEGANILMEIDEMNVMDNMIAAGYTLQKQAA